MLLFLLTLAVPFVAAQLTGHVGPTTSSAEKRLTICNVLNYGGSIGSKDIGPAIQSAFDNCVTKNKGSTLYIPPGNYDMATWVSLNHGSQWALQLDGVITRTGTAGGNMFLIQYANDYEIYSSTSKGAIQGNGYQCRNAGQESPEFHVALLTSTNTEVYNLAIRGADLGGSDGIDVSGNNIWIHDVEVTNRDECVTVKNPSNGILIEQIFCNQSGGSAMGSLGSGTAIENITYRYIYAIGGDVLYQIKSYGGDGYVKNVIFDNFIGLGTSYGLFVNEYWSDAALAPGNGVEISNVTFSNWDGYIVDGSKRAAISILCADKAPCTGITLQNVNMWASNDVGKISCESAYGSGGCLKSGSGGGYASTTTSYSKPAGYKTPVTFAGSLQSGFSPTAPIPIPTILTTYFPGRPQISPLASSGGGGSKPSSSSTSKPTSTSTSQPKPTSTTTTAHGASQTHYGQCGGTGWTGPTTCQAPYTCKASNAYYSQCL